MTVNIEQVKQGMWIKYRGEWAFVCGVNYEARTVWLSNWQGQKTTVIPIEKVEAVRDARR